MTPSNPPPTNDDFDEAMAGFDRILANEDGIRDKLVEAGLLVPIEKEDASVTPRTAKSRKRSTVIASDEWPRGTTMSNPASGTNEAAERLRDAVGEWFAGHCPADWTEDDHLANPTVNMVTESESQLALAYVRQLGLGAAPDVPPEAIEWARELVHQGYRDEHIVTFTEISYGLEHPIRCRPNLNGCILNEWLATQMGPDREPGRYVMEWRDNGPWYGLASETPRPGAFEQGAHDGFWPDCHLPHPHTHHGEPTP